MDEVTTLPANTEIMGLSSQRRVENFQNHFHAKEFILSLQFAATLQIWSRSIQKPSEPARSVWATLNGPKLFGLDSPRVRPL